jgi:hypothetical protein
MTAPLIPSQTIAQLPPLSVSIVGNSYIPISYNGVTYSCSPSQIATAAGVGPLTITDGTHSVNNTTQITFSGATISGTSPNGIVTITGASGITFTDGTHTVTGATQLTVTGGTIGGSSPNATLTVTGGGGSIPQANYTAIG